jgi:hypothetical protein
MDFASVDAYLKQMYKADAYTKLSPEKQAAIVFDSLELLKSEFSEDKLTDRLAAIQVLYTLEGEDQGYSMLKRQGVTQYANKGVSATFGNGSDIAPSIIAILKPRGARVARLR